MHSVASDELPPGPAEVFRRSAAEGRARLERSVLGQVSTGLTAGVNIVFAIIGLGIAHHLVSERFGTSLGQLAA